LLPHRKKIYEELRWKAEYSLEQIIETRGNGISGKVKKDRPPLLQRMADLFTGIND
jgi:hypothetical protein